MADQGFLGAGATAHFTFEFDQNLNGPSATALANALAATAENDYNTVDGWFDGLTPGGVPFTVQINLPSTARSGSNNGNNRITIDLGATSDFTLAREVLVAEFTEILMNSQGAGWDRSKSNGEALSQVAGYAVYPAETSRFNGPKTWLDSATRPDFVSTTDVTDSNAVSYGCGVLFLYYLTTQLGCSMRAIVQAAADTLEGVYHKLTQDSNAFGTFAGLLSVKFPPGTPSGLAGSANPFPLPTSRALSGVQYVKQNPLTNRSFRERIHARNIGQLRAVLNSDRPASLKS